MGIVAVVSVQATGVEVLEELGLALSFVAASSSHSRRIRSDYDTTPSLVKGSRYSSSYGGFDTQKVLCSGVSDVRSGSFGSKKVLLLKSCKHTLWQRQRQPHQACYKTARLQTWMLTKPSRYVAVRWRALRQLSTKLCSVDLTIWEAHCRRLASRGVHEWLKAGSRPHVTMH